MFLPKSLFLSLTFLALAGVAAAQQSYGERLGYRPTDKVLILHIDDAGMSLASNLGTVKAMEQGIANSVSIMMPCSWVPHFYHYLVEHPTVDSGLHLTLTSEWGEYRWGPLAGKSQVPGLVDREGCLWPSVPGVVMNASPEEVEKEIRAQIDRAKTMGFEITHLDSHMGTLFTPKYIETYVNLGIEYQIPILMFGGHLQFISEEAGPLKGKLLEMAEKAWNGGLPVIDDLHNGTYGWKQEEKSDKLIEVFRTMKPGITEIIFHASQPTEEFPVITESGPSRLGDLEALTDPRVKQAMQEEGILLTTWRELMQRRKAAGAANASQN